jgi:hypothetical protein
MRLSNHVTLNFNNKMSTTVIFLDIEKSFWHRMAHGLSI